jgi:hypothetical protein
LRTVDYSEVLSGSAALSGMGPTDIGSSEFVLFRQFHDRRLQKAWEIHAWPDLCRTEQRTFRPLWSASTTYGAGPERYDVATANYYQSLQAANLNNPPTIAGVENSAWWAASATQYSGPPWAAGQAYVVGSKVQNPDNLNFYQCFTAHTAGVTFDLTKFGLLTPFDRYVGFDQVEDDGTLKTPIGEFLFASDVNPKVTTKGVEFPFTVSENGAQFTQLKHSIAFAWIFFRIRRLVLVGDDWDASAEYGTGRQVYFVGRGVTIATTVGNFYTALEDTSAGESPETEPTKWDLVEIPYIFRGYLITGGYADWLTGDGQGTKALAYEGMAVESLELEADKLQRQGGQVRRLSWRS